MIDAPIAEHRLGSGIAEHDLVTKPLGGGGSTSISFQLRSGDGSRRGSMASSPQQAKASRRRRLQRRPTCQLKIEQAQAVMQALIRRPWPQTLMAA
jgi:hypothetical protein